MNIFPAIDLFKAQAVRLFKGDYDQMTVYHPDPCSVARDFYESGARFLHLVDLEGAKCGELKNLDVVKKIAAEKHFFIELGGGIRDMKSIEKVFFAGVDRVILGTAAVTDPVFLKEAVREYGDRIAVGVDIKDGFVAIKGWTEKSEYSAFDFCEKMQLSGIKTLICTDISKDGAMRGTNRKLYRDLSERFQLDMIASGGVSSLEDIKALSALGLYGAIIGKAYYTGAIDLNEAIEVAR